MNVLFVLLTIASIIMICITSPDGVVSFMLDGTKEAVNLTIKLTAIYALWSGLLQIMVDCGIDKKIAKLFKPFTKRAFKGESEKTQTTIAMNLTANFLGMGGVATSMGIDSMTAMGNGKTKITRNMMLFFIINVSSVQLLPTTVIALRSSYGSGNPSDIILPAFIASVFTTAFGVVSVVLIEKIKKTVEKRRTKNA